MSKYLSPPKVDEELKIYQLSFLVKKDVQAHKKEHSLETQLPFLQFYSDTFKIIPICMMRLKFHECEEIGRAIVKALKQTGRSALIVASSDMTHYETHENASKKDKNLINQILKLDAKKLHNTARNNNISMCGVDPTTVMLMCANEMGAKEALLAKYMTSGEVSGDLNRVVGYAGLIVR